MGILSRGSGFGCLIQPTGLEGGTKGRQVKTETPGTEYAPGYRLSVGQSGGDNDHRGLAERVRFHFLAQAALDLRAQIVDIGGIETDEKVDFRVRMNVKSTAGVPIPEPVMDSSGEAQVHSLQVVPTVQPYGLSSNARHTGKRDLSMFRRLFCFFTNVQGFDEMIVKFLCQLHVLLGYFDTINHKQYERLYPGIGQIWYECPVPFP